LKILRRQFLVLNRIPEDDPEDDPKPPKVPTVRGLLEYLNTEWFDQSGLASDSTPLTLELTDQKFEFGLDASIAANVSSLAIDLQNLLGQAASDLGLVFDGGLTLDGAFSAVWILI